MDERKLFETSGIRGETGREITDTLARRLGYLVGQQFGGSVALGYDQRHGAKMLAAAAAAGLMASGANVLMVDHVVPIGVFSHFTWREGRAGMYITASHMPAGPEPPARIGLIVILPDGRYCGPDMTDKWEGRLLNWYEPPSLPDDKLGDLFFRDGQAIPSVMVGEVVDRYLNYVTGRVDAHLIKGKKFRILFDAGNGTTGATLLLLMERLGVEVEILHRSKKARPDRPSEVNPGNCKEAIAKIVGGEFNLGVASDGDGDRGLIIDEKGRPLTDAEVGAIFARHVLRQGDVCVSAINASRAISEVCAAVGAQLVLTKVGQPATGAAVSRCRAIFCYEEAAGKNCFPVWPKADDIRPPQLWYDTLLAAAMMLEIMAVREMTLSQLVEEAPKRFQAVRKIPVDPAHKQEIVAQAQALLCQTLGSQVLAENWLDGLRIELAEGWVIVRPSGTENVIRVQADAPTQARADELVAIGAACVEQALKQAREEGGKR